jgi:hypothetical protein
LTRFEPIAKGVDPRGQLLHNMHRNWRPLASSLEHVIRRVPGLISTDDLAKLIEYQALGAPLFERKVEDLFDDWAKKRLRVFMEANLKRGVHSVAQSKPVHYGAVYKQYRPPEDVIAWLLGHQEFLREHFGQEQGKILGEILATAARNREWGAGGVARNLRGVLGLSHTQAGAILRAYESERRSGLSDQEALRRLNDRRNDAIEERTKVVAQHEVNQMWNKGTLEGMKQRVADGELPPTILKVYLTVHDGEVCEICSPLHYRALLLDEDFDNGLEGKYHWSGQGPPAHIRCRCSLGYAHPGELEDEKRKPFVSVPGAIGAGLIVSGAAYLGLDTFRDLLAGLNPKNIAARAKGEFQPTPLLVEYHTLEDGRLNPITAGGSNPNEIARVNYNPVTSDLIDPALQKEAARIIQTQHLNPGQDASYLLPKTLVLPEDILVRARDIHGMPEWEVKSKYAQLQSALLNRDATLALDILTDELHVPDQRAMRMVNLAPDPELRSTVGVDTFLSDLWNMQESAQNRPTIPSMLQTHPDAFDTMMRRGYWVFFDSLEEAEEFIYSTKTVVPSRTYAWQPVSIRMGDPPPLSGWVGGPAKDINLGELRRKARMEDRQIFYVRVHSKPGTEFASELEMGHEEAEWVERLIDVETGRLMESEWGAEMVEAFGEEIRDQYPDMDMDEVISRSLESLGDEAHKVASSSPGYEYERYFLQYDMEPVAYTELVEIHEHYRGLRKHIISNPGRLGVLADKDAILRTGVDVDQELVLLNRSAFFADPDIKTVGAVPDMVEGLPAPDVVRRSKVVSDLNQSNMGGVNQSAIIETAAGEKFFIKTTREGMMKATGSEHASIAGREVLAYQIADMFGVGDLVPKARTTLMPEGRLGVLQEYLPDITQIKYVVDEDRDLLFAAIPQQQRIRFPLFEWMLDAADRHDGNYVRSGQRFLGVDYEESMAGKGDALSSFAEGVAGKWWNQPIPREVLEDVISKEDDFMRLLMNHGWEPDGLDLFKQKFTRLRKALEFYGREPEPSLVSVTSYVPRGGGYSSWLDPARAIAVHGDLNRFDEVVTRTPFQPTRGYKVPPRYLEGLQELMEEDPLAGALASNNRRVQTVEDQGERMLALLDDLAAEAEGGTDKVRRLAMARIARGNWLRAKVAMDRGEMDVAEFQTVLNNLRKNFVRGHLYSEGYRRLSQYPPAVLEFRNELFRAEQLLQRLKTNSRVIPATVRKVEADLMYWARQDPDLLAVEEVFGGWMRVLDDKVSRFLRGDDHVFTWTPVAELPRPLAAEKATAREFLKILEERFHKLADEGRINRAIADHVEERVKGWRKEIAGIDDLIPIADWGHAMNAWADRAQLRTPAAEKVFGWWEEFVPAKRLVEQIDAGDPGIRQAIAGVLESAQGEGLAKDVFVRLQALAGHNRMALEALEEWREEHLPFHFANMMVDRLERVPDPVALEAARTMKRDLEDLFVEFPDLLEEFGEELWKERLRINRVPRTELNGWIRRAEAFAARHKPDFIPPIQAMAPRDIPDDTLERVHTIVEWRREIRNLVREGRLSTLQAQIMDQQMRFMGNPSQPNISTKWMKEMGEALDRANAGDLMIDEVPHWPTGMLDETARIGPAIEQLPPTPPLPGNTFVRDAFRRDLEELLKEAERVGVPDAELEGFRILLHGRLQRTRTTDEWRAATRQLEELTRGVELELGIDNELDLATRWHVLAEWMEFHDVDDPEMTAWLTDLKRAIDYPEQHTGVDVAEGIGDLKDEVLDWLGPGHRQALAPTITTPTGARVSSHFPDHPDWPVAEFPAMKVSGIREQVDELTAKRAFLEEWGNLGERISGPLDLRYLERVRAFIPNDARYNDQVLSNLGYALVLDPAEHMDNIQFYLTQARDWMKSKERLLFLMDPDRVPIIDTLIEERDKMLAVLTPSRVPAVTDEALVRRLIRIELMMEELDLSPSERGRIRVGLAVDLKDSKSYDSEARRVVQELERKLDDALGGGEPGLFEPPVVPPSKPEGPGFDLPTTFDPAKPPHTPDPWQRTHTPTPRQPDVFEGFEVKDMDDFPGMKSSAIRGVVMDITEHENMSHSTFFEVVRALEAHERGELDSASLGSRLASILDELEGPLASPPPTIGELSASGLEQHRDAIEDLRRRGIIGRRETHGIVNPSSLWHPDDLVVARDQRVSDVLRQIEDVIETARIKGGYIDVDQFDLLQDYDSIVEGIVLDAPLSSADEVVAELKLVLRDLLKDAPEVPPAITILEGPAYTPGIPLDSDDVATLSHYVARMEELHGVLASADPTARALKRDIDIIHLTLQGKVVGDKSWAEALVERWKGRLPGTDAVPPRIATPQPGRMPLDVVEHVPPPTSADRRWALATFGDGPAVRDDDIVHQLMALEFAMEEVNATPTRKDEVYKWLNRILSDEDLYPDDPETLHYIHTAVDYVLGLITELPR